MRTQIARMRHGSSPLGLANAFQVAGAAIGFAAVAVDTRVLVGAIAVCALAVAQSVAIRRKRIPAVKVIGLREMAAGLAVVVTTAVDVLA